MIILFDENEVLFNGLGLGILKDAKSCQVVEELKNYALELEMIYPYNGSLYRELKIDRIIYCKPNPYDEAEPFRIYSISKPIKDYVTVKAQHISYDMNGIPVKPISGNGLRDTIDKIQNGSIVEHNFKIYTEKSSGKTFKTTNIYNMRAILLGGDESLLSVYDLEVKFNKFNVYLSEKRGANRGATITYAKNLKDITHEINYERLYNGVYPFYHQETTETKTDVAEGEFKQVYIVGTKPFQDGWFSYTDGGEPYHPIDEAPVQIATEGDYYKKVYCWNATLQRYQEKIYDQTFTLIDNVTGILNQNSETPRWVTIDWQSLTSLQLVLKAGEDGYFKMSTETEWTYHSKGEVVYEGSVKDFANALLIHYSEVIPETSDSTVEETTNVTHVELDDKIIWIDTILAKSMKVNRILTLDLTSEFKEVPDKEALETKAKEYIEKNKIGQYKFDTSVSFIDLSSTTEGFKYSHLNHIELGDVVRVTYSSVGIDVELRVVATSYDAINDKYINIDLGEKPDKLSGSSVQNGDNISSLTNDVGYTDVTTVNKLVARIVTADYIKAKNAELSKAQIEQLEAARIKVSGMLEASQFEIDNLVAKLLTADNAIIKQTLEAGTIKVKGDISIASGMITIENTEDGTSFRVDRSGNVIANSLKITGGSIRIQDTFEVTNDGLLTATAAKIEGEIVAKSGEIAGFEIKDDSITYGREDYGEYIQIGTKGIYLGAINTSDPNYDPSDSSTWKRKFQVNSNGSLYTVDANITGTITATSGNIAGFSIHNGYLSYGTKQQDNSVYVGIDGIYLGTAFNVTRAGILTAENVNISGYIETNSGHISGFTIQNGYLEYSDQGYVHVGTDAIRLGRSGSGTQADPYKYQFEVTSDGEVTAKHLDATGGSIAGFSITSAGLYGSDISSRYRVHITPSGEYLGSTIDLYMSSSHWSYRDIYNGYNGPYAGALMIRGGEMLVEGFQSESAAQVYNYRLPLEAMVTQAFGITNSPIQIGFYRVNNISASTTSGSFTIKETNGSILAVTANYIGAGRESSIGVSWSGRTVTWRRSATTQAVDIIFIYICSAKAV